MEAERKLLTIDEVKGITRLSTPSIYRLMRQDAFPRQVRIGLAKVAWFDSEIASWLQHRADQRGPSPTPK